MRILVTGGAGFIGGNLIRLLSRERPTWELINLDCLTYAALPQTVAALSALPRYRLIRGDIADPSTCDALPEVDAILHLAAESHVDRSLDDPAPFLRTNVLGTQLLLRHATRRLTRLLHVSTDEVYGDLAEDAPPATEDAPLRPSSPYAASKAAADHLVLAWHRSYGLPALITRCTNNYGPGQHPEKFIPRMIGCALRGEPLPIYGDGLQIRDWMHVDDHCRGILAALEHGTPGTVYNLGADNPQPNLTVARAILDATGAPRSLLTRVPDRPGHDRRYAVDATRARRDLGWSPALPFADGLAATIRWYTG